MKFLWATINVKDMEESLSFYQEIVGLKFNSWNIFIDNIKSLQEGKAGFHRH